VRRHVANDHLSGFVGLARLTDREGEVVPETAPRANGDLGVRPRGQAAASRVSVSPWVEPNSNVPRDTPAPSALSEVAMAARVR